MVLLMVAHGLSTNATSSKKGDDWPSFHKITSVEGLTGVEGINWSIDPPCCALDLQYICWPATS